MAKVSKVRAHLNAALYIWAPVVAGMLLGWMIILLNT